MSSNKKFILIGFSSALLLLILYFSVLSLAESFSHAISQFLQMWYWILLLAAGFGIQVGLFVFIKEKQKMASGKTLAVSGGVSTGSMIVCCLHHLTDVLPLMGLAAATVFLIQYQLWFIFLGILSNFVGITIMLEIIQKKGLSEGLFKKILIFDMGRFKKAVIASSVFLLAASFLLIKNDSQAPKEAVPAQVSSTKELSLSSRSNSGGGLSVEVAPLDFAVGKPLEFKISFNTHQGSLDYDFTKKAVLIDDQNNRYLPLEWQGGSGGHHLSGVLVFPPLKAEVESIELNILDIYGVPERKFYWELK